MHSMIGISCYSKMKGVKDETQLYVHGRLAASEVAGRPTVASRQVIKKS